MRYTFTIEIPDKRGSHENDHVDFLKAASKQMEETLTTQPAVRENVSWPS